MIADEPLMLMPPSLNGMILYYCLYFNAIGYCFIADTNSTEFEDSNITIIQSSIEIPVDAFSDFEEYSYVLSYYATNVFFQVTPPEEANASDYSIEADTEVIGFTIPDEPNITNLSMPVIITLQSMRGRSGKVRILFF